MKKFALYFVMLTIITGTVFSENQKRDYNTYYAFPVSMGIEYQNLSPFNDYGSDFNIFQVAGIFRFPLSKKPSYQPLLKFGITRYDSRDYMNDGDKWDFDQLFGGLGIVYANRFSKDFETGFSLEAGASAAFFQNMDPSVIYMLPYAYGSAGGYIALTPSYGLSLSVKPEIKYQYAIASSNIDMGDFNGLSFGMGISIHYRFGEDPDSASSIIRSLQLTKSDITSVFAAMQSYYFKNPIGTAVISNKENKTVKNVEVLFFQSGIMDAPTPCTESREIKPGESLEIPLYAFFNDRIFTTEGVTPYTGEIIVRYEYNNRPAEQRFSVSYDLYDKTALTWDNAEKVAAFITPADSALRNYSSFVRQSVKKSTISTFNTPLQNAVAIFDGLSVLGVLYQSDPSSPFTRVQDNTTIVDSVSLARDTLKRTTGDCDDLTVLYCSLLETVGIETAYITVPGHIYAAFNTKVPSNKFRLLHSNRKMMISLNGELWIPVEITMIGVTGFQKAWQKGVAEWVSLDSSPEARSFYRTHEAQKIFRPVGLKETDLGLQYGSPHDIETAFRNDITDIKDVLISAYIEKVKKRGKKQDYNRLGVRYSTFGIYDKAEEAFSKAIKLDRNYIPAQINKANLELMAGNIRGAINTYQEILKKLQQKDKTNTSIAGKLMLNIAKSNFDLKNYEEARRIYDMAKKIVPEESKRYAYISSSEDSGAKASDAGIDTGFIFIEDSDYEE